MLYILYVLTVLAFLAVVFTLVAGARAMSRNDDAEREKSNKWMTRRVMAQAAAIILLIITVKVRRDAGL